MSCESEQVDLVGQNKRVNMSANPKQGPSDRSNGIKNSFKPLCRFFNSTSGCRNGRYCTFSHSRETYNESNYDQSSIEDDVVTSSTPEIVEEKTKLSREEHDNADMKFPAKKQTNNNVCSYYLKYARCWFGNRCKFEHIKSGTKENWYNDRETRKPRISQEAPSDSRRRPSKTNDQEYNYRNQTQTNEKAQYRNYNERRWCKYFQSGYCAAGSNCRFKHFTDDQEENQYNRSPYFQRTRVFMSRSNVSARKDIFLKGLNDEELIKLRQTEVEQLLKRFTKDRIHIVDNDNARVYKIKVSATDPDWPYDVAEVELDVFFPEDYPKQVCTIEVSEDEYLPAGLIRHLNKSMLRWLRERHSYALEAGKVELLFRPFLRWLDQNMEEIFTVGLRVVKKEVDAKASGIEFVPFEQLRGARLHDDETTDSDIPSNLTELSEEKCPDLSIEVENLSIHDSTLDSIETSTDQDDSKHTVHAVANVSAEDGQPRSGIEMKFRSLELSENATTLAVKNLGITIECSRCRNKSDIKTPPRRMNSIPCPKCHHHQQLRFRPGMLHQYSAIAGYLDIQGATPFDVNLFESHFSVGCLECDKEMPLTGLHYGQRRNIWCENCNAKMTVFIDSVKFTTLQPANLSGESGHLINVKKPVKSVRDPAVQEGKPLPDNGTCKHFKKSYRWLRFPCCGKCYPCDVCHNENELDHDIKYATRMLCGFCAKEQPYTGGKPCISCSTSLTNKSSAHWEGGRGCRDKIKMSRGDTQKYVNTNKTVAKKVVDKKEKKKPK